MGKKCQKYNIIQMLESTLFFSKMFLSKCTLKNIYNTLQICSGMFKSAPKALQIRATTKNNSCHFYSSIISVHISNVFASLVVQFYMFTFCVLDLQILLIVSLLSSNIYIINNYFPKYSNKL